MKGNFINKTFYLQTRFFPMKNPKESLIKKTTQWPKKLLEEEMTTHFSILAWKIPQTEDPGRLQSIGLQRVGQD